MRRYRVWTKDFDGSVTIMTDWLTRNACKKMIHGRWGHLPPFAIISSIQTVDKFIRRYGE